MKPIFIWRVVCCSGIVLLLDPERGNKATSLGSCLNLIKTEIPRKNLPLKMGEKI